MHSRAHSQMGHRKALAWLGIVLSILLFSTPARVQADGLATVVLAFPDDPYLSLAQEIATADGLPLAHSFADALSGGPEAIIWVVAPERLSEMVFAQLAQALKAHGQAVALGLISGSSEASARRLWQRQPASGGTCVVSVPREGTVERYEGGKLVGSVPLGKDSFALALRDARLVSYQGHGSRGGFHLYEDEEVYFTAEDVPDLPPLVVSADACQTFKIWSKGSIAIAFVDRGAAAYVGFLQSPIGYMIGEPKGFPLQYTWPEYPIGHVLQVQTRGLTQGFIGWPYLLMLGDPRRALRQAPPYRVISDQSEGDKRVLKLGDVPSGIVPVYIPQGATYDYVEIVGVGRAYRGDPFYDPDVQMADIGPHKYLLIEHGGGEMEVRLLRKTPLWWPVFDVLQDALDHTTLLSHVLGSLAPSLLLAGVVGVAVLWRVLRHRERRARDWGTAIVVGLVLTLARTVYALVRREYLTSMYVSYLRTMIVTWEISPIILGISCITAIGACWLFLGARRWWGRMFAGLGILGQTSLLGLFWLGAILFLNLLAVKTIGGLPMYKYGMATMALITAVVEGAIAALSLWVIRILRAKAS